MASAEREAAERLLESGRHDQAVERFRALLAENPDDPVLRGRLAEAYRASGNGDRAFHHYDQAARTLSALGRDELAASFLERADGLVPDQPEILFRRARALERLGREDDLVAVCDRLRRAARATGDRRCEWAFERLVERRPDDLELARARARFLLDAGRAEAAAEAYQALLARGGGTGAIAEELAAAAERTPELHRPLAEAALAAGDPRRAVAHLAPLHEKDPGSVPTLELIVRALEALDQPERLRAARIELVKATLRTDRPADTLPVVGRLLGDAPRDPEAVEVAAHAFSVVGRAAESAKLWARLLELHHAAGRSAERDRAILQLLRTAPEQVEALRVAARVLAETGRTTEAHALEARIERLEAPPAPELAPAPEARPRSVYGRGLSWGRAAAPSASPSDTLEDPLGDSDDTDDMEVPPEASESLASAALEAAVAHLGEASARPGARTAFERRYPSTPSAEPPDLLPEE